MRCPKATYHVLGAFVKLWEKATTHNNPHNHTQPTHSETHLCNTTYCYSTYQHETITLRSRQLLMMDTWLPETCWATIRREIKNTKVTSSWFFLSTLNYDSRSTTHQIQVLLKCDRNNGYFTRRFVHICYSIWLSYSYSKKYFRHGCKEYKKDTFMFYNVFPKIVPFMRKCPKILYSRTGHIWKYKTTHSPFLAE